MNDRGMVKWQPFNSVTSGVGMVDDVIDKRSKKTMPVLSEDQIMTIQNKMLEAYNNQDEINVIFYLNGHFFNRRGKIIKIDKSLIRISFRSSSSSRPIYKKAE
jgi:tRNA(His) 5'-end guanylyltransferase